MDNKRLVAKKIKDRLEELGISRKQFAGMMKVKPSGITKWLSGKCNFEVFALFEIERVLDMPIFDYEKAQKENHLK